MNGGVSHRHSAGFGKAIELWVAGLLLKDGFDVFLPLVDDKAVDMILRGEGGRKLDIQIKARSSDCKFGNGGMFHGLAHPDPRDDYYYIFYAGRADAMWLFSSHDLIASATLLKNGRRNLGLTGRNSKKRREFPKPRYDEFLVGSAGQWDFSRLRRDLAEAA